MGNQNLVGDLVAVTVPEVLAELPGLDAHPDLVAQAKGVLDREEGLVKVAGADTGEARAPTRSTPGR